MRTHRHTELHCKLLCGSLLFSHQIWEMAQRAQKFLALGYTSQTWLDEDFLYSYYLWVNIPNNALGVCVYICVCVCVCVCMSVWACGYMCEFQYVIILDWVHLSPNRPLFGSMLPLMWGPLRLPILVSLDLISTGRLDLLYSWKSLWGIKFWSWRKFTNLKSANTIMHIKCWLLEYLYYIAPCLSMPSS